jgi:hypothetical protein
MWRLRLSVIFAVACSVFCLSSGVGQSPEEHFQDLKSLRELIRSRNNALAVERNDPEWIEEDRQALLADMLSAMERLLQNDGAVMHQQNVLALRRQALRAAAETGDEADRQLVEDQVEESRNLLSQVRTNAIYTLLHKLQQEEPALKFVR